MFFGNFTAFNVESIYNTVKIRPKDFEDFFEIQHIKKSDREKLENEKLAYSHNFITGFK